MKGQKKGKRGIRSTVYTRAGQRGLSDGSLFQPLKIRTGKKKLAQKPWKVSSRKRE